MQHPFPRHLLMPDPSLHQDSKMEKTVCPFQVVQTKKKKKESQGRPAKPQQCKGAQVRHGMPCREAAMGLCLGGRLGLK